MPRDLTITRPTLKNLNKATPEENQWNPHLHKYARNKILKDAGEEYEIPKGRRAGTIVPAKPGPSPLRVCRCTKSGCNLPFGERTEIYRKFRRLGPDAQNQYISQSCDRKDPVERIVEAEVSNKKDSYSYSVKVEGRRHYVCQKMLCNILCITASKVKYQRQKTKDGKENEDERGRKSGNQHQVITEELQEEIRTHIRSYPVMESHYCREAHPNGPLYLGKDISLKQMWRSFNERQVMEGRPKVGQDTYKHIFKTDFKLKFRRPKKDTCDLCDIYEAEIQRARRPQEKIRLQQEKDEHLRKAQAAIKAYKKDKEIAMKTPNQHLITIDMQKVIFVPRLSCASAFFRRTFSTFNCGVHDEGKNGYMHTWSETTANHCSPDVISCLWKYITTHFEPIGPDDVRELTVCSDRCIGQFLNQHFIRFDKYIVDRRYFSKVTHKFFVTGHSFNDCDRDFAMIERSLKKVDPQIPKQVNEAIKESRVTNQFKVTAMRQEDFLNFKNLEKFSNLPPHFHVTERLVYEFRRANPNTLFAKEHHSLEDYEELDFESFGTRGRAYQNVGRLYNKPLLITKSKADDLKVLMKGLHGEAHEFFKGVTQQFRKDK